MLNYLDREGILKASVPGGRGRGRKRLYSYTDLVLLRSLKRLLDAGVGVKQLKKALAKVRQVYPADAEVGLGKFFFVTDGHEVFLQRGAEVIEQLSTGQLAFAFVVEIGHIQQEVDEHLARQGYTNEKLRRA